jgi:single-strand DNA-binding protein
MANFNKVILIGRLTRDPEVRTFANGGKVAKIGFATSNPKKNTQTGQWEEEPMFIDIDVFNKGEFGKQADLVQDKCRKGTQILVEGKLHLDQWEDKNGGGKRSKHRIVAEVIRLLDGRPQDGSGGAPRTGGSGYSHPVDDGPDDGPGPSGGGSSGKDEEIPF